MSRMIAVFEATLDLGKVDYLNNGKCSCPVEVSMELTLRANAEGTEYWEFTAVGDILNHLGTKIYHAGQCLDTIAEFRSDNKDFRTVYAWWKKYHLNSINPGTREQMEAIAEYRKANPERFTYKDECDYLESLDLYEVKFFGHTEKKKYNGELYRYGTGWVINFIPEEVVEEMKDFVGKHKGTVTLYDEEGRKKDITKKVFKEVV